MAAIFHSDPRFLWISDLKELHNQVAEAVAKVAAADEKIKTEELFKALQ